MAKKFKRRDFMKNIYWGSLGLMRSSSLVSVLGSSCKTTSKKPPNIVLIMATCVDVSGAHYPAEFKGNQITPMEGKSPVPVFCNQTLERDGHYFEHEGNRAVHWGKWKLVAKGEKGVWELYDMEADRTETNNLASGKSELVKQLAVEWKAWAERAKVLPWPWKKGGN